MTNNSTTVKKNRLKSPRLAIVVPCLNEAETLPHSHPELSHLLTQMASDGLIDPDSFILYVDDGSSDSTWAVVENLANQNTNVKALKLAVNAGHQLALMAGLHASADLCDATVSIDADLQDNPEAIPQMLDLYLNGHDVVFGVRRHRSDKPFKRFTAEGFYRLRQSLGVSTVREHADFRLMSARAVKELCRYGETNLFLRGIVPMIGFRQGFVYYDRRPRIYGKSKYPLSKMLNFAADGITSFSVRPARMILWSGILFMVIALAIFIYSLIRYFTDHTIAGWTSTILSIWFCSGMLLLALGILGEYLAKVYMEVKRRPRWHIEESIGLNKQQSLHPDN